MELIARLAAVLGITEEEAQELFASRGAEQALVDAGETLDLENPSDEELARLGELSTLAEQVREAVAAEDTAADERRSQAAVALANLRGETAEVEEPAPEAAPETPAETPEPAPEAAPEAVEEVTPEAEAAPDMPPVKAGERVAASAGPATRVVERPARPVKRTTPAAYSPKVPMRQGELLSITAAADLPDIPAGKRFETFREIANAALARHGTLQRANGVDGDVPVATIAASYPDEFDIRGVQDSQTATTDRIEDTVARRNREVGAALKRVARGELESITAAGGFCAPTTPVYDLLSVSTADRPVRDSLPSFQANRGGIRYVPPPHLTDVVDAVSTWSASTDASPGNSTKPCLTVTCDEIQEQLLDAIPVCLQFGNFQARAFPEQVDRFMQLAVAYQARYAERKILTEIGTNSTNISTGVELGAWRDFLAEAIKLSAQYRNRHRMAKDAPLRVIAPAWARDMFAVDIVRGTNQPTMDAFTLALVAIDRALAAYNLAATWSLEGESGQDYGAQVQGGALPWKTSVVWYLFHEGAWVFLDGGTLDIGLVRDSTLNARNNFQNFSETFEQVVFRGVESLRVSSALCASGAMQVPIDVHSTLCSLAS